AAAYAVTSIAAAERPPAKMSDRLPCWKPDARSRARVERARSCSLQHGGRRNLHAGDQIRDFPRSYAPVSRGIIRSQKWSHLIDDRYFPSQVSGKETVRCNGRGRDGARA